MVLGGFSVSNFGQKMRTAWCRLSFHWHAWRLSFRNFRFKMPRSERVILHVSINMGRLPGERVLSKCRKGRLNNFEMVCSHWRQHPEVSWFPIFPSPGPVEEVRYSRDFPQERNYLSEIQQVFFSGVIFEEFPFHLENCRCKMFLGKIRNPQNMEVSCNCVCDLDLAAQVLWVI